VTQNAFASNYYLYYTVSR